MLSQCTLVSMLTLQDDVNRLIDPCWRASGNPFLRAAMMEAAEALDHHGWKWWKKHSIDLPQLQLELVDIWHFLLSDWIIAHPTKDFEALSALLLSNRSRATSIRLDELTYHFDDMDLLSLLQLQVGLFACKRSDIALFGEIMGRCQMSWDDLARQYIGKNALNIFRQRHGYQHGTYIKEWHGKEDNEHMFLVLSQTDMTRPDAAVSIIESLGEVYLTVLAKAATTQSANSN